MEIINSAEFLENDRTILSYQVKKDSSDKLARRIAAKIILKMSFLYEEDRVKLE